jgi:hypothetical protein
LVATAVAAVVVAALVALTPRVIETRCRVSSRGNVRGIVSLLVERGRSPRGWPRYDGKNFVLSLVAFNLVDRRNRANLEIFFSPGDRKHALARVAARRYDEIDRESLEDGDFHELTSYAGRRNRGEAHRLPDDVPDDAAGNARMIVCDDDDGPLHQPAGLWVGFTDGSVRVLEWEDVQISPPEDPDDPQPFQGEAAAVDALRALDSGPR